MTEQERRAIVVSDSNLGNVIFKELVKLQYVTLTESEWRNLPKNEKSKPVSVVIFCNQSSFLEPRKEISDLAIFNDQWNRLVDGEMKNWFELSIELLPNLQKSYEMTKIPSSIIYLGSKVIRIPNSPMQVISSTVKRAVNGFAGSLFFENRSKGVRISCINPGPEISMKTVVDNLLFPLTVGNTTCVECIDLTSIKPFPSSKPHTYGACFVTGGSRGIGKSIAVEIAKAFRMPIALLGRDEKALSEGALECEKYVGKNSVLTFSFDARDSAKLKEAIEFTAKKFGGISVLVCSAGINRRASAVSEDGKKVADPKVWKDLMDINFGSAITATAYSLPFMINRPEGPSIFYVGSRLIRLGQQRGQQAYIASKMGIAGFAASVQQEVRNFGVRVVCLNVGLVATDLGNKPPKGNAFVLAPPETQIQPEDVAKTVIFTLKSDTNVSPTSFDLCGMTDEFLSKDGAPVKFSKI